MTRVRTSLLITAAVALGLSVGARASGQVAAPKAQFQVDDVQLAWCLDFLVDPAIAGHLLPRGWTGIPASAVTGLPIGLTRTFDEDAKYKEWLPARVCGISARSSSIGGTALVNDKPRRPPTIGWLQLSARKGQGEPELALPSLVTNTFRVRSPLSALTVKLDDMAFETGPDPEKDQVKDGLLAKFSGATIGWIGYLSPDSLQVQLTDTLRATYQNDLDKSWDVVVVRAGGTGNRVAGLVNVAGKGALANALKASPIRLMGRIQTGGTASVTFYPTH